MGSSSQADTSTLEYEPVSKGGKPGLPVTFIKASKTVRERDGTKKLKFPVSNAPATTSHSQSNSTYQRK